jgi:hypothetical protein
MMMMTRMRVAAMLLLSIQKMDRVKPYLRSALTFADAMSDMEPSLREGEFKPLH